MHAIMITFRLTGMSAERYGEVSAELAPSFGVVPGLLTKIWLTADQGCRAGFYLFTDSDAADRFVGSALARMVSQNPHFADLAVQHFTVDEPTTAMTQPGLRVVPAPSEA